MRPMPTLEELKELLSVDTATGTITWRGARNSRGGIAKPGAEAGWRTNGGYRTVTVRQRDIKAHRLVWLFAHGRWPDGQIDHINGDRSDNRIENLRDVTPAQNNQNHHGLRPDNTSGVKGVYWDKRRSKWCVQISANRKHIHVGQFDSKEDAAHAAAVARTKYHPHAHEA